MQMLWFSICTENTSLFKTMEFGISALPAQVISTKEVLFKIRSFIFLTGCSAMKP